MDFQQQGRDTLLTEVITAPTETVTPLRMSEALRLGRLQYPNPLSGYCIRQRDRSACVTGAIAIGGGMDPHALVGRANPPSEGTFMGVWQRKATVPCACFYDSFGVSPRHSLYNILVHLNDTHIHSNEDWTEADVVNWLDKQGL